MREAYLDLRAQVNQGAKTTIDPYGATHPAEFFAVVTEQFFEQPHRLQQFHLDVYTLLPLRAGVGGQAPACGGWGAGPCVRGLGALPTTMALTPAVGNSRHLALGGDHSGPSSTAKPTALPGAPGAVTTDPSGALERGVATRWRTDAPGNP